MDNEKACSGGVVNKERMLGDKVGEIIDILGTSLSLVSEIDSKIFEPYPTPNECEKLAGGGGNSIEHLINVAGDLSSRIQANLYQINCRL